jgi:hypothetical protein
MKVNFNEAIIESNVRLGLFVSVQPYVGHELRLLTLKTLNFENIQNVSFTWVRKQQEMET